jgi:hypothetical protein
MPFLFDRPIPRRAGYAFAVLAGLLATTDLAAAAPPAQKPEARAPQTPREQDIEALETFLSGGPGGGVTLDRAIEAEARLDPWPDSLSGRESVRGVLQMYDLIRQFNSGIFAGGNRVVELGTRMIAAADRIDRTSEPAAWAASQAWAAEFIGRYFWRFPRARHEPVPGEVQPEAEITAAWLRARIAPLLEDRHVTPEMRAKLLVAIARGYTPGGRAAYYVNDIDTGLDFYRQAWRAAIADGKAGLARQIVWEAAERTFHGDRSGRRAEAVLAGAAPDGPKDWLEWGGTHQVRMRIAEAREDDAAFERAAALWVAALRTDSSFTRAPLIGGGPFAGEAEREMAYVAAPLRRGDTAAALARLDFIAARRNARPGAPPPEPATIAAPEGIAGELGVDHVIMAVGGQGVVMDNEVVAAIRRGDTGPMTPVSSIAWGRLSAASRREAGPAAVRSGLDPRLSFLENGRGFASYLPEVDRLWGLRGPWGNIQEFIAEMGAQIPRYEDQFFQTFGKPIDDLAGGRCASNRPLSGPPPRILLIASEMLNIYPVEMARAPNGRRLIDCYEFRRAPTLAAARASARHWQGRRQLSGVSGVWDPENNLPFAQIERAMIATAARESEPIAPLDPSSDSTVLRPANGADILHIAAHGRFSANGSLNSGITVAPGRLMSVTGIRFAADPATIALAVLSACETGLSDTSGTVADTSIAAALMANGTAGVVGALWQVDDGATALVMGKFYELLLRRNRPPAAALREAQLWARDASLEELLRFIAASERGADPAARANFADLRTALTAAAAQAPPGTPPLADPLLWGGFGFFGTYAGD